MTFMRLRSSQFVFLLLLVCSVQIGGEGCALRLMAEQTLQATPLPAMTSVSPGREPQHHGSAAGPSLVLRLSQSAIAAERAAWPMPHPALAFTAVASFTGLLRA